MLISFFTDMTDLGYVKENREAGTFKKPCGLKS